MVNERAKATPRSLSVNVISSLRNGVVPNLWPHIYFSICPAPCHIVCCITRQHTCIPLSLPSTDPLSSATPSHTISHQAAPDVGFAVGDLVEGTVHEIEEYGVLVNLTANEDMVGFVATHQTGSRNLKPGEKVQRLKKLVILYP